MTWDIAVVGTLHIDDITTPVGHRPRLLGGSAVYFPLVASAVTRVHVNGIVGSDAADEFRALLKNPNIDLAGLAISNSPTYYWHATHDFDRWVAVETGSDSGCDAEWLAQLTPAGAAAPVFFAGSMPPTLQQQAVQESSARLIAADTMVGFIENERAAVEAVVESADILFVNQTEMLALAPNSNGDWLAAAQSLIGKGRTRAVVVKGGPEGATCISTDAVVEKAAHPVGQVVDPTGAGDALAGGFLSACAEAERDDEAFFATALEHGVRAAANAVGAFGTELVAQN